MASNLSSATVFFVWLVLLQFKAAIVTKIWQVICFMGPSPFERSAWLMVFCPGIFCFATTKLQYDYLINNVAVCWKAGTNLVRLMLASFTYGWCFMSLFCFSCLWLY
jgi:hypothetical protein